MDGPNVNWRFFTDFNNFMAEEHGHRLVNVGSCGLHTVHNAVKDGFKVWNIDSILRGLHKHFSNQPARREDFTEVLPWHFKTHFF
jgi:hypothetical protein